MRETVWNGKLNSKLKEHLRFVWGVQANAHNGIADNYYLGNRALWMEAKMIPQLPKRETTLIIPDCSELQYEFLDLHYRVGKNSMVMVAVKKVEGCRGAQCIPFVDPEEWHNGITCAEAKGRLLGYKGAVDLIQHFCFAAASDPRTSMNRVVNFGAY